MPELRLQDLISETWGGARYERTTYQFAPNHKTGGALLIVRTHRRNTPEELARLKEIMASPEYKDKPHAEAFEAWKAELTEPLYYAALIELPTAEIAVNLIPQESPVSPIGDK